MDSLFAPRAARGAHLYLIGLAALALAACGPSATEGDCTDLEAFCDGECVDTSTDPDHCGACGVACFAGQTCEANLCVIDNSPCEPGEMGECYSGPAGTIGVGVCTSGTRTCTDQGLWDNCQGEVTPTSEMCGNGVDDDCNGAVDDDVDEDGDGFTTCNGDCCDRIGGGCADPTLVNPGAFEAAGNMVDDDCDGTVDNEVLPCDMGLPSNSADATQYAAAMDICQMASGDRWGLATARLTLADGTGAPNPSSRSIRPDFGSTAVQLGSSMAVLSTGNAADATDTNPPFAAFEIGADMGTTSGAPADWLAANGGAFPNPTACPPSDDNVANDAAMLELSIKVPTNAKSFSFKSNFFSAEYPEWVCTEYNDFFVVLLDSAYAGNPENPPDKNLARYTAPDMTDYPVGVNLAYNDTGLFQVCQSGSTGCSGSVPSTNTCALGTSELTGTGMDAQTGLGCAGSTLDGGGTGWLQTSGNVVGGETITLRIALWDTSDHIYDSIVLLDSFQWSVDSTDPGTIIIE